MNDLLNYNDGLRIFIYIMTTIFGLLAGSFFNVVALRLLKEESFVFPASHCPKCNHPIRPYDNIPVISYILLGGKCRDCKEKIHIQYPIVEAATGFLFLMCVMFFGLSFQTLGMMLVISALIVLTITDLYEQLIFDITSVWLIPFALVYNLFNLGHNTKPDFIMPLGFPVDVGGVIVNGNLHLPGIFISGIIGIILSIVFFEGLSWLAEQFFGKGKYGFGMGDTKLCAGLGAWFGWEALVAIIFISFVFQGLIGLPLIVYQWFKEKDWVSVGSIAVVFIAGLVSVYVGRIATFSPDVTFAIIIACFVIVLIFMIVILFQVKKRQSFTYLPLGPAIALAALVIIFYGQDISKLIDPYFTLIGALFGLKF